MVVFTIRNTYSYINKFFNSTPQHLQNKIVKECSYRKKISNFEHREIYLIQTNKFNQSFEKYYRYPTGLTSKIVRILKEYKIEFKFVDERQKPGEQISIDKFYQRLKVIDDTITERDYQREAVEIALKCKRGLVNHSTSAGKTIVISGIIYCINVKTLVLCIGTDHVSQLSKDIRKYTERNVTVITGGNFDPSGDIVVANVQALNSMISEGTQVYNKQLKILLEKKKTNYKEFNKEQYDYLVDKITEIKKYNIENKYDKLLHQFKAVLFDECFIPGTLVETINGKKKIEEIKKGDLVLSYNEKENKYEYKKVIHLFKNKTEFLCKINANNNETISTLSHPFYTTNGIKEAQYISNIDMVQCIMYLKYKKGDIYGIIKRCLQSMWRIIFFNKKMGEVSYKKREDCLLFSRMLNRIQKKNIFRNSKENKYMDEQSFFGENEKKQSYEKSRDKRETENNIKSDGLETTNTRREWKVYSSSSNVISSSIRVGIGSFYTNEIQERFNKKIFISYLLQNRYCKFIIKNWNRSRWSISQFIRKKKSRQEERKNIKYFRVENTKIYKRGSDAEFESMCPEGFVYNIEVEDNNNYFANNILVHNCHYTKDNGSFQSVIYHCVNAYYKFGFSGTIHREDGSAMEIVAAFGPVISKFDYTDLTNGGYISQARFFIVDPMCDPLYEEEDIWPKCLQAGIIDEEKRNNVIAKIAKIYTSKNKQVLIISPFRKTHGDILQKLIPGSQFLYGETEKYIRDSKFNDFREKKFNVIITTKILDEFINLPDVRCVMSVGGGKSSNKVYQRIGRGLRKADGKDFVDIIVFWDSHSRILFKHSVRMKELIQKVDIWKDHIKFLGNHRKRFESA